MTKTKLAAKLLTRKRSKRRNNAAQLSSRVYFQGKRLIG